MGVAVNSNHNHYRIDLSGVEGALLPSLLDIQVRSFEWFCFEGIKEVFDEVFPIVSTDGNYEMRFENYYVDTPKTTTYECLEKDLSFEGRLMATFSFHVRKTGEIKEQEVYIAEVPFMTPEGTFIINGVERVIVSQLVRSPGVYFTKGEKRTASESAFMVKVIPYRGAWLKYEYDPKNRIYQVRIDSPRRVLKIPITIFLKALGFEVSLTEDRIFLKDNKDPYNKDPDNKDHVYTKEEWPEPEFIIRDGLRPTLERDTTRSQRDAQKEIWRKLHPTDPFSADVLDNLLPSRFYDEKKYDLAKVGRYILNQRLGLGFPENKRVLTSADILGAFKALYELQEYGTGTVDDVDHLNLENRRVEHVGELLQAQMRKGLLRVERIIREKMMQPDAFKETPKTLINTRPLIGVVKEFFGSSQMSQFMDNTNPLASLTHKRRLSALGPKGLTREAARFDFRDVHHSHYGRICPIESPEGPNIGLISSLSTYARVNRYGFIETPYLKVVDGRVTDGIEYLSADQEAPHNSGAEDGTSRHAGRFIAPSTVRKDKHGNIVDEFLYVRVGGNFEQVHKSKVEYVEVSPMQFISVTTSLIPFLEHNDANRALMGSNMQRQGVPLLFPQAPLVGTGTERRIAEDAGSMVLAPFCGEVAELDSMKIVLRKAIVRDGITGEILEMPSLESSGLGEKLTESKYQYMFAPPELGRDFTRFIPLEEQVALPLTNDRTELIPLRKFKRSNQGTLINHRVRVGKNQVVLKGDLLADSACTSDGELALGRNVLVAFMPWRGYNFEDAILVTEKLLKDDSFTSVHIEKHECEARQTKLGPEKITREITGLPEEYIEKNLDDRGIIRVGAEVKASDVLVGKITPKGESDLSGEEKLIRAVFGDKGKGYKNTPLKVPHGQEGVVIDTQYFSRKEGHELQNNIQELARVFIAKKRTLKVGDKMAGRHGNKGVVSMILPEEDMPFLADGTTVEVILNPLGVPSRMNIGQVLETHLGLACSMLEGGDGEAVTAYLKKASPIPFDRSRQETGVKIPRLTYTPAQRPLLVQTPVFNSVSEDEIRKLFTKLDIPLDGKTELFDGVTGEKFKERVMVGVMYVMKLNHLVDDKMHARSTGSYALITQQPLGGKAQFGGQRLGEMEVWALEGYGASYLLKEMLTVKSDDVNGRNRTYKAIVDGKVIPEPGIPESFNVMVNELRSLSLDVKVEAGASVPSIFLEEEDKDLRPRSLLISDVILEEEDLGEDIL